MPALIVPVYEKDQSYFSLYSSESSLKLPIQKDEKKTRSLSHKIALSLLVAVILTGGILSIPFFIINLIDSDGLTSEIDTDFRDSGVISDLNNTIVLDDKFNFDNYDDPSPLASNIFTSNFTYNFEGVEVVPPSENEFSDDQNLINLLTSFFIAPGSSKCRTYNVIDLVLVYESSFCRKMGGKQNAEQEVIKLVKGVSKKFEEQGLCMHVRLSYLEGWCNNELDPFMEAVSIKQSGCTNYGLLDEFYNLWEDKAEIDWSMKLLLSGTEMEPNTNTCAYSNSICTDRGLGVTFIDPSIDTNKQVSLIAQTLGFIAGASHDDVQWEPFCSFMPIKNIMCPQINEAIASFWGETTIVEMKEFITANGNCLRVE